MRAKGPETGWQVNRNFQERERETSGRRETPERSAAWWAWLERPLYVAWIPGRGQRGRVGVEGAHHPPPGTSSGLGQGPARWDTDSLRAWLDLQKMDRNQDGVVTIDEFLETCQKVGGVRA